MNISTIIDAPAADDPGRAALIIDGRTITYGELADAVERCAAGLAAGGVAGRRVAVVDVGSLLSIATMLGAPRIGAAAALMNPALTPRRFEVCSPTPGAPRWASLARRMPDDCWMPVRPRHLRRATS